MSFINVNIVCVYLVFEVNVLTYDGKVHAALYNTGYLKVSSFKNNESNIVGTFVAREGQFAHQVSVQLIYDNMYAHVCGGALISESVVLSAAHCFVYPIKVEDYIISAGSVTLYLRGIQHRKISDIYVHPKYVSVNHGNDIAVITTVPDFRFSENIHSIELPSSSAEENIPCVVSGWGSDSALNNEIESPERKLRAIVLYIRNRRDCLKYAPVNLTNTNVLLCAGGGVNENTCTGDSGSALVCKGKIYGIVSFGAEACEMGKPIYFSDVVAFKGWVIEKMSLSKNETPFHYKTLLMVLQVILFPIALLLIK